MSDTYTVNTTDDLSVGKKYVAGSPVDTWSMKRSYLRFNINPLGIVSINDIEYIKLHFYVATTLGTAGDVKLTSGKASTSNWGTTLTAGVADFISTNTAETIQSVSTTGWQIFNVDKNNIDLDDWLWLRLKWNVEGDGSYKTLTIRSQNYATSAYRPYLEIKLKNRHSSVLVYG